MINNQAPMKQEGKGEFLSVNDIFDTIQGEGPFTGMAATFIRLAGCNLQCVWCDTEYSDSEGMSVATILENVNHPLVVITGGEPLRQDIRDLVSALNAANIMVQIETNGTLWLDELESIGCAVVVSPKTNKLHPKMVSALKHHPNFFLKFLIGGAFPSQPGAKGGYIDPDSVTKYIRSIDFVLPLDLQDDQVMKDNIHRCVEYCKTHPETMMQLQMHKIIGVK